jgi:hypothetical protein
MSWTTTPPMEKGVYWWLPDGQDDPASAVLFELWSGGGALFAEFKYAANPATRLPQAREVERMPNGRWGAAVAPPLA